jgi:tRNA1Val (adenine37-N6)-methyltransferase
MENNIVNRSRNRGEAPCEPQESINGLFRNKVRVIQAKRGYRVSEDALILTWFFGPRSGELILDAGSGCGVISFGLAIREPAAMVVGVEIQAKLADRAIRGAILNDLQDRVSIVRGDFRLSENCFKASSFDAVVCNPPYYETGAGRISVSKEKALARHQLMMPPAEIFRSGRRLLCPDGRLSLIYPADRLGQLVSVMKEAGFKLCRMLWIHPQPATPPLLVCIEARPYDCGKPLIEKPLFLYDGSGSRTPEAEAALAGE